MLLAQGLGLWHGTLHAPALASHDSPRDSHTHAHAHPHQDQLQGQQQVHPADHQGWVDDHRAGDPDCRLLDQLLHADVLAQAPELVLAEACTDAVAWPAGREASRAPGWHPPARGPPRG